MEDSEEDADGTAGADPGGGGAFSERWGWIASVDAVSETVREGWDQVFRRPVLEFLNILAYRKDKREEEKRAIEEWKRTH